MALIYLFECPALGLRWCSGTEYLHPTAPAPFRPRISSVVLFRTELSADPRQAGSRTTAGSMTLKDHDKGLRRAPGQGGEVNLLAANLAGQAFTLKVGDSEAAYSSFQVLITGKLLDPAFENDTVTITFRDPSLDLDVPLARTTFAGTNAAPTGTEGTADDVKGQYKPVCYGRVRQVALPIVNGARPIFQAHDGQIEDIDAARDKGVTITRGAVRTFATIDTGTDPAAGQFDFHLGSGSTGAYARLVTGELRTGPFTFDIKGDKRGGTYRTTAADIAHEIVTNRPSAPPGIVGADATALNAASSAVNGFWNAANGTVAQCLNAILPGVQGKWWFDAETGSFRMGQLVSPGGAPAMSFVRLSDVDMTRGALDADILSGWRLLPPAIPIVWRVKVNYRRFWQTQTDGLDANVSAALKAQLQNEWRSVTVSDAAVLSSAPAAAELTLDTCLDDEADAASLATSVLNLFKVRRDTLNLPAQLSAATYAQAKILAQTKVFNVLDYGDGGRAMVILGRSVFNPLTGTADFTVWG
jgi:hypothetical protein